MNSSTPTPTPAAASPKKSSSFARIASIVIAVVMVIVFGMIVLGRKTMMGKRYKVSETESVNYSGNATEEDARKVGEALKADGYMSGKKKVDVLLKKDDKDGTVVSFVGYWDWKDEKVVSAFKQVGEDIAAGGLGKPLTIRLLDDHLNTRNEIKVP
jgi:hypothetical protein